MDWSSSDEINIYFKIHEVEPIIRNPLLQNMKQRWFNVAMFNMPPVLRDICALKMLSMKRTLESRATRRRERWTSISSLWGTRVILETQRLNGTCVTMVFVGTLSALTWYCTMQLLRPVPVMFRSLFVAIQKAHKSAWRSIEPGGVIQRHISKPMKISNQKAPAPSNAFMDVRQNISEKGRAKQNWEETLKALVCNYPQFNRPEAGVEC